MNLNNFFKPNSIAVIGASSNPEKIGRQILDNIISSQFRGKIYPVNLQAKKIAGLPAFSSLEKIKIQDKSKLLVVLAIPAPFVGEEIENAALLGAKNFIVISAGFKEVGKDGKKMEENLVSLANKYKLNILGPNCLGFINNMYGFNASFSSATKGKSKIALVSQSGAIGSAVLDWLRVNNLGLGYFISLGNKAVLNENNFLKYLDKDKDIEAIIFYLEDIVEGKKFMEIASVVTKKKPVVVLLSGLSESGKKLAFSHTGAMAKEPEIIKAALSRSGVLQITEIHNLFNLILLLKNKAFYNGLSEKITIITNAGGLAVLSADYIEKSGLDVTKNIDLLGDAQASSYEKALSEELSQNKKDNILILLTPQTATNPLEVAKVISKLSKKYFKRAIMCVFVGGQAVSEAKEILVQNNIPVFDYPEEAIKVLSLLKKNQQSKLNLDRFLSSSSFKNKKSLKTDYVGFLSVLKSYGIKVVSTRYFKAGDRIKSFPVVLKAVGPDFVHKTDKGGVILNLRSALATGQAVNKLIKGNKSYFKNRENRIVIQDQKQTGLEIILGLKQDDNFGHVLLFGLGGIYAEALGKAEIVVADLNKKRALAKLQESHLFSIIKGVRGKKYNLESLVDVMVALCKLAKDHPEIKELDINPLLLTEKEAIVLDARVLLD
jgi:acetyltransferase